MCETIIRKVYEPSSHVLPFVFTHTPSLSVSLALQNDPKITFDFRILLRNIDAAPRRVLYTNARVKLREKYRRKKTFRAALVYRDGNNRCRAGWETRRTRRVHFFGRQTFVSEFHEPAAEWSYRRRFLSTVFTIISVRAASYIGDVLLTRVT